MLKVYNIEYKLGGKYNTKKSLLDLLVKEREDEILIEVTDYYEVKKVANVYTKRWFGKKIGNVYTVGLPPYEEVLVIER